MAGQQESFQERTEEATPKRREDARQEGQVARSQDLNSAAVLVISLAMMLIGSHFMVNRLGGYMRSVMGNLAYTQISVDHLPEILAQAGAILFTLIGPFVLAIALASVLVNVLQFGVVFSAKAVEPDPSRMNPISGVKNLFSVRSLVELIKSIAKIILVGSIVYLVLSHELPRLLTLIHTPLGNSVRILAGAVLRLFAWALAGLIAMAIIDLIFQRWNHGRQLRMTLQEVKEERKQTDGDPQLKSRIRSMQMEVAYNRMLSELPRADVVVTNPTHLAVALRYDQQTMAAPVVVAKGQRLMAEKIKTIAREHDIPIIENVPLARALFKACQVGEAVPVDFYRAVAEVLAWVYRIKRRTA